MRVSKNRERAASGLIAEREDLAFHREIMLRLRKRLRPPIANKNQLIPETEENKTAAGKLADAAPRFCALEGQLRS